MPDAVRALRSEAAVRTAIADLNKHIIAHLRAPAGPHVPLRPVDAEKVVAEWRAAQPPAASR